MPRIDLRKKLNKEPIDLAPGYDCPAVRRCCDAWHNAYLAAEARGLKRISPWLRANEAYRNAMPPLNTPENIRDFIACAAHGLIVGAIVDSLATQLLAAARAANSTFKNRTQDDGAKSSKNTPRNQRRPALC